MWCIFQRIMILIWTIHIREDANSHKVIWCNYLPNNLCTTVERTSQIYSGLRSSFSSMHVYLVLVAQSGAVFGVGFARSLLSSRKLHWSPSEHWNTTLTPAIRKHRPCFNYLIPGVKVSKSEFLIYASLHHRLCCFDNRASISSDEFPCRAILIRIWVDQTSVLSIGFKFPRRHQVGSWSLVIKFHPISYRIPEHHHYEE